MFCRSTCFFRAHSSPSILTLFRKFIDRFFAPSTTTYLRVFVYFSLGWALISTTHAGFFNHLSLIIHKICISNPDSSFCSLFLNHVLKKDQTKTCQNNYHNRFISICLFRNRFACVKIRKQTKKLQIYIPTEIKKSRIGS